MEKNEFKQRVENLYLRIVSNINLIEVKGDSVQHLFATRLLLQELETDLANYLNEKLEDKLNKEV